MSSEAVEDLQTGQAEQATFDLELFETLNDEYRSRPLVPTPPRLDQKGRNKRARQRLAQIAAKVELEGNRVLEIGCAHGQLTRLLVKKANAREAIGVDIVNSDTWERFSGRKVSFHVADLATEELLPLSSVDVVVSNSVLEHVHRPLRMLEAIGRLLTVGGEAWLTFNLHRGPKASHRYREVFFPWPHLLFDPFVCASFYRKHHGVDRTFAWVNRLTAAEYVQACHAAGLHVAECHRVVTEIDVPFYRRFIDELERYPALDLETDFLVLVLRKRRRRPRKVWTLDYLERQRELDEQLERLR